MWESQDTSSPVTLTLAEDGAFTATGWPSAVECGGQDLTLTRDDDVLWQQIVSYSGEWEQNAYGVQFTSSSAECSSNWTADAWMMADGSTSLRVDLAPRKVDDARDEQFIYFDKQ